MNEGRTPCGNINPNCKFDALKYESYYPDLKNAFHGNVAKLTNHYKNNGINEKRLVCKTSIDEPVTRESMAKTAAGAAAVATAASITSPPVNSDPDCINAKKTLIQNVNDYIQNIKNPYITKQNEAINSMISGLSNLIINEITELIKQVNIQNEQIQNQISIDSNRKNFVKSEYQRIEVDKLQQQNFYLYVFFYLLLCFLSGVMWYQDNISMILQLVIFHVLLLWPFIIYYIELFIYIISNYLISFFSSTPFSNIYIGN
jgi:hypothetical protein